jgi:hydroxymethylbilane synthase
LIQTNHVVDLLRQVFPAREFVVQTTRTLGDRVADLPLDRFGRTGVFVRDLSDLLRQGKIDLAVHSLKDVPPDEDDDLVLAAFPEREDPRDVIVSSNGAKLMDLPNGARIGTSSVRRRALLGAIRPDLDYRDDLRGNVDTRIRKLRDGQYEAIVLAAAGLIRLGRPAEISEYLPVDVCLPDAGQGMLVVQARRADHEVVDLVSAIDDTTVRACATGERSLIRAFGGGCSVPVAAFAQCDGVSLDLRGLVAAPDGSRVVRARSVGPVEAPETLGRDLWQKLVASGAHEVLQGGTS